MIDALGHIAFGLFGLAVLLGIAVLFSANRREISWKLVATGIVMQIVFAALVLKVPFGRDVFNAIATGFVRLLDYVRAGSDFIFGSLMDTSKFGFVFAFQVLPTIIFFAALTGVLYHLGIMQKVVKGMAWIITKFMNVSGAETTSVCASVFIGQTEAPLTIKPYLERMTQSELMTVMIGGMAHIAGSVMAAYVGLLGGDDEGQRIFFATHLLTASIMAAPATLMLVKILMPETEQPLTQHGESEVVPVDHEADVPVPQREPRHGQRRERRGVLHQHEVGTCQPAQDTPEVERDAQRVEDRHHGVGRAAGLVEAACRRHEAMDGDSRVVENRA